MERSTIQNYGLYARSVFAGAMFAAACFGQSVVGSAPSIDASGPAPAASANLFGVTKGPEGTPLAGVRVVVRSLDEGTDRVLTTDSVGAFAAPDLKPGRNQLMANKDGFVSSPIAP